MGQHMPLPCPELMYCTTFGRRCGYGMYGVATRPFSACKQRVVPQQVQTLGMQSYMRSCCMLRGKVESVLADKSNTVNSALLQHSVHRCAVVQQWHAHLSACVYTGGTGSGRTWTPGLSLWTSWMAVVRSVCSHSDPCTEQVTVGRSRLPSKVWQSMFRMQITAEPHAQVWCSRIAVISAREPGFPPEQCSYTYP
jgi:hypothetical protein